MNSAQTGQQPKKHDWFFLFLCLAAGLALRLDFLAAGGFVIDADEAIVGLMAKHMLEGHAFPVFYYGQHYMGSFEAALVSLVFRVFGISSAALKGVPLFFSLILIVVAYFLAQQAAGRTAARLAAIFCAIPPSPLVVWSAMARGGFIEIVVIGAVSLLAVGYWLKSARPRLALTLGIWLLLGFGWWVNNQIIYFAVPISFFMFCRLIRPFSEESPRLGGPAAWFARVLTHLAAAGLGFIGGGLPFWLYNLRHDFISFEMFKSAGWAQSWSHLQGLFALALPILMGAKRFWQSSDVFPHATWCVWIVYGAMLVCFVYWRRYALLNLLCLKVDRYKPLELHLAVLLAGALIFAFSSFGYLAEAPRYLLPLYVPLFVISAAVLERFAKYPRLFGCLTFLLLGFNLMSSYLFGRAVPGQPFVYDGQRVSRDHRELIEWLETSQIGWVKTNYWIGYRLAFETKERVRFLINQPPFQTRIEAYRREGKRVDPGEMPLVLVPAQAEIIRRALEVLGYSFKERKLSNYVVFYGVRPRHSDLKSVKRRFISVSANAHPQAASLALDGDIDTRWGSAAPQKPGMEFIVTLDPPQPLAGLSYELGAWAHDYPRGLSVELELESGESRQLFEPADWSAVRYLLQAESQFVFFFDAQMTRRVILRQLGKDGVFDWSIAELKLLQDAGRNDG